MPDGASKEQVNRDVDSWLESGRIDDMAHYAARGRAFEALSDDELEREWIASFRAMVKDYRPETRNRFGDLSYEFEFRGKQAPYEMAKPEADKLSALAAAMMEEITRDPARYREVAASLNEDLDEYRRKRDADKS